MTNICNNCNTEFQGTFCPQCGTKAVEQNAEKTELVQEDFSAQPQTSQPAEPEVKSFQVPVAPSYSAQPKDSVFSLTITQTFNVIKNFFSKNTVEAISAQHQENLNIWIILFLLPAIFSGISGLIHYTNPAIELLQYFSIDYTICFGRFGYMVSGFFFAVSLEATFLFTIFLYLRLIRKKKITFKSCANLVSSAYLPITLVSAISILLGRNADVLILVALTLFVYLLYTNLNIAFKENGPSFWSFVLLVTISFFAFILCSLVISIPGWIIENISANLMGPGNNIFYPNYNDFFRYY